MNFVIESFTLLLFGLIWVAVAAYLRLKEKKSYTYLLFFTLFSVYVYKVLDYTLFQFQSLIVMKYFMPGLLLRGLEAGERLNLIPLVTLTLEDFQTSFLNILLFIPFGFGLPFITSFKIKKVVFLGAVFSIGIEVLQFLSGLFAGISFRIADVNDVIFNTLGAFAGYILFLGFVRVCRLLFGQQQSLLLKYIISRPQAEKQL